MEEKEDELKRVREAYISMKGVNMAFDQPKVYSNLEKTNTSNANDIAITNIERVKDALSRFS